jgi:ssDNA-binding Zn-finger/Zn-ribbon topoisomerase 1
MAKQAGPCPTCGAATIVVTVRAFGEPLSIVFCPECGHRRWASDRESMRLDEVIARFREVAEHERRSGRPRRGLPV